MKTPIRQLVNIRETASSLWLLVGLAGLVSPFIAIFSAGGHRVDYFVGGFSLFAFSMVISGMTAPWMFPGLGAEPTNNRAAHISAFIFSILVAVVLVSAVGSKIFTTRELLLRLDALAVADEIGAADRALIRNYATCLKSEYAESVLFDDIGTQATVRCGNAMLPGHGLGAMYRIDQLLR